MKQWDKITTLTKIPQKEFLKILEFCLKDNNYFKYGDKLYNQTFGMPMGNPLSPTIADIILDDLLNTVTTELASHNIETKGLSKYVDDLFAIIKECDKTKILQTLNKYHKKLQFTIETELNNRLPYLDVCIFRSDKELLFNWYTKPTASGRMINYLSTQPLSQKINTARNLINKVCNISDAQFKESNLKVIKNILQMNNFPLFLTNNLLKTNKKDKPRIEKTNEQTTDGNTKFYSVQYIPNLTDNRNLHKMINNNKASYAHKPNTTLKNLFSNLKAPIEKEQQHNVVYLIGCNGKEEEKCNLVYIGTTKRALGKRITEHKADVKKGKETTGLSQHMIESGHTPDFDNTIILDKEKRTNARYTLESLRIQQNIKRTMNTKEDRDNTIGSYAIVFKKSSLNL